MYDAIVIGARCAGSPTAIYLMKQGLKVLLIDRAAFPSEVVSSHHIAHAGMDELRIMGLAGEVAGSGCPAIEQLVVEVQPFERVTVDFIARETRGASFRVAFDDGNKSGFGPTYAPRRSILDRLLLDAAGRSGAEVRLSFRAVRPLLNDRGAVVGIEADDGKRRIQEAARIVIGADGMNSWLARQLRVPYYNYVPSQTCVYHSYFSGFAARHMEYYLGDGFELMVVPTHNALTCVGVGVTRSRAKDFRAHVPDNFRNELKRIPDLAERFAQSRQEERFVGSFRLPNFFRQAWGPGWALVGDAGYHRDPISGRGISDAFRHARFLADAVGRGLDGDEAQLPAALQNYQERRDQDVKAVFEATIELAKLAQPTFQTFALLNTIGGA